MTQNVSESGHDKEVKTSEGPLLGTQDKCQSQSITVSQSQSINALENHQVRKVQYPGTVATEPEA